MPDPFQPLCQPQPPTPSSELTFIAQLQVQQGIDTAHSLLAGSRPCVCTSWGEESNEEAQVVEGHQGLEWRQYVAGEEEWWGSYTTRTWGELCVLCPTALGPPCGCYGPQYASSPFTPA
jgi:hypothetical protein